MRIVLLREKHILVKCTCKLNVYIIYFYFALDVILGDRCDRKTTKTNISFKYDLIFWWFNLVKMLLSEEMLVFTSF